MSIATRVGASALRLEAIAIRFLLLASAVSKAVAFTSTVEKMFLFLLQWTTTQIVRNLTSMYVCVCVSVCGWAMKFSILPEELK